MLSLELPVYLLAGIKAVQKLLSALLLSERRTRGFEERSSPQAGGGGNLETPRALRLVGRTNRAARASFSAVVSRCLACLGVAVWAALVS